MSYINRFAELKQKNLAVANLYDNLQEYERAQNIRECGTQLVFGDRSDGRSDLIFGNYCRDRFCPTCAYRLMLRRVVYLNRAIDRIGGKYILITLTVLNVRSDELRETLLRLTHSFSEFYHDERFKGKFKGYQRNIEVTFNPNDMTFHPHIHMIVNVDDDYFDWSGKYINRNHLLDIWRAYYHDDRICQVDMRRIKGQNQKQALLEACKYVTKFSKWIDKPYATEVLGVLKNALYKVKTTTYGGTIAKALRELKHKEYDESDLDWRDQIIQNANFV